MESYRGDPVELARDLSYIAGEGVEPDREIWCRWLEKSTSPYGRPGLHLGQLKALPQIARQVSSTTAPAQLAHIVDRELRAALDELDGADYGFSVRGKRYSFTAGQTRKAIRHLFRYEPDTAGLGWEERRRAAIGVLGLTFGVKTWCLHHERRFLKILVRQPGIVISTCDD
jgi:hypothetical protein